MTESANINGVTPEPDSNEDSSDFMYEGITIEPPTPNPTSHPSDLFTISFTQSSIPVPQDGNNPSSSSSLTSFSSKPETVRLANNGYEEKRTSLGAESPQGTYSDVLEKHKQNSNSSCSSSVSGNSSSSSGVGKRRSSQPVTGSPREPDFNSGLSTRRSSEGSHKIPIITDYQPGIYLQGEQDEEERKRMSTQYNGPSADWTANSSSLSHIFVPTSNTGDSCYVNQNDCKHSGSRLKCVACRIIVHEGCIPLLNSYFICRQSYRESVRKYREQTSVEHHWVQRRNLKGKCKFCAKTFQSKLAFGSSSSVVGLSCSWCKYNYHHKGECLNALKNDISCDLGNHAKVIVPPSWIVKLPRKGSFKSSLKCSPNKYKGRKSNAPTTIQECQETIASTDHPSNTSSTLSPDGGENNNNTEKNTPFCVKPIPSPDVVPILVFLNPKSGGNQGAKLMQKFQWLLNPRQVFDLTQGGPGPAIEMFRKVPNIRLLACGGDGTVGWVLSILDKIPVDPPPAVGVLPLGTGNDLSRSLGWGGGYTDEPISKIISAIQTSPTVKMDRWQLSVTRNSKLPATEEKGEDQLPRSANVVNNYFSLGVDAQIALQFHEAREANPQKFNSRIRNKMYYGQAGGKDLLLRKWKDLSDMITVECDGQDITQKLKEHRVHSVLFANIPSFSSGTRPWSKAAGEQRIDDGLIEVIGLSTYQLPMLQAGGHGTCITQCKKAKIITKKTIPMQVDGEACRLNPATIELSFLNQVVMMAKTKGAKSKSSLNTVSGEYSDASCSSTYGVVERTDLRLSVSRIRMSDYETYHHNKAKLKELARPFGEIKTTSSADLEHVRALIGKLRENNPQNNMKTKSEAATCQDDSIKLQDPTVSSSNVGASSHDNWCFVDSVTAIRFFRIDRAQENLHYVLDICDTTGLYILDDDEEEIIDHRQGGGDDELLEIAISQNDSSGKCRDKEHKTSHSKLSGFNSTKNIITAKSITQRGPHNNEKTTEGILKAARLGDLKMLAELHREGYSLLSIDETGKTALHYGARFGHKEIVKFLIGNAPYNILDMVDNEKGQTALHKAAAYKRRTICCMLVAAGASLLVLDGAGLSSRQLALMAEDLELAEYLKSQEHFQEEKVAGGDPSSCGDFETPV